MLQVRGLVVNVRFLLQLILASRVSKLKALYGLCSCIALIHLLIPVL